MRAIKCFLLRLTAVLKRHLRIQNIFIYFEPITYSFVNKIAINQSMSQTLVQASTTLSESSSLPAPKGKWYSEDEVHNLIISSYKDFKESLKKQKREAFEKNLDIARDACEELYKALYKHDKIKCRAVHLRFTSLSTFDAILAIPQKDYLSESFNKAYISSLAVMNKYNTKKFFIDFSFIPAARSINNNALISDGYYFSYKTTSKGNE